MEILKTLGYGKVRALLSDPGPGGPSSIENDAHGIEKASAKNSLS